MRQDSEPQLHDSKWSLGSARSATLRAGFEGFSILDADWEHNWWDMHPPTDTSYVLAEIWPNQNSNF